MVFKCTFMNLTTLPKPTELGNYNRLMLCAPNYILNNIALYIFVTKTGLFISK